MQDHKKMNVADVIDNSQLHPFQIWLLTLCGACLIMDGFDVQAISYVAPSLIADWGIAKPALGPVFGAGLFGMLLGSILFSMLADKIGRRPVLIGATLFFGLCTLATAFATNISELLILRLVTGLGLGAIIPNAIAIAGEYSPARLRVRLMMIISGGFIVGAALGGFVSAAIIPHFGWPSVFVVGGLIPILISAAIYAVIPESLQFLVLRGNQEARIAGVLRKVDPAIVIDPAVRFCVTEQPKKGMLLAQLFREGRARATILIWTLSFMNLLVLFFLSNWLPVLMKGAGFSTSYAVLAGTALQVGGIVGTLALGWIIDRRGFTPVLRATFVVATVAIVMIGQVHAALLPVFVAICVAGFCIVGGQPVINALAATYYPTSLRSTGIGWSVGVGRFGSIVGPVIGGELLRLNWSMDALFIAAAVPAAIAALTTLAMRASPGAGASSNIGTARTAQ